MQVGSGPDISDRRWLTKWRALSKWMFVFSACSTARCHRSVTRTTTVLLTRRASSTHTTLHSTPARPTLSLTAPGPGGAPTSAPSSKRLGMTWWDHRHRVQCIYRTTFCLHAHIHFVWRLTYKHWALLLNSFKQCFVNFRPVQGFRSCLVTRPDFTRALLQTVYLVDASCKLLSPAIVKSGREAYHTALLSLVCTI